MMGRSFIHINMNSHVQLSIIKISLIWLIVITIVHLTNLGALVVSADNSTVPIDACFPLIYSASLADGRHLPAWLSFSSSDRTFSGVPSSTDIGQLMVRITAQDTHGSSSITDFLLNVAAPGQSNEITDKVVTIPSTIEFTIYSQSFPDLDNQTVVMNSSLADSSPLPPWLSFFPTNNTFLGAPSVSDAGEYLVRVRAQDQNNSVQLADFKILVNRRPVVLTPLGNHTVTANQLFQYTIQVPKFFQDPDDNPLMLYVSKTDGTPLPSWLSFSSNTFSGTPLLSDSGYLQIVVRASDGYVSVESTFSIFVNQPPYIKNRIPDRLINAGSTVQFGIPSNSFFDNDSSSLELHTQMNNGDVLPNWLTFFGNNHTFVAQPPNNIHGSFLVEVSAIDSFGASTSSSFVLTVNRPPVLNMSIPVLSVTIGGVVTYKIPSSTFYDPDGSSLTISIIQQDGSPLPSWLTFNPISSSFFGFPDTLDAGEWHLNVSATDGAAYVSTDLSLIVNRKPQINNMIAPQHVTIGSILVYHIDDSIFVDPDNNTLTLTASKANVSPLPLWLLFFNSNNTFFGVPGVSDYGTVMIRVTASDSFSSIYVDFQLRVNRAPLLVNPVADQVVNAQHSFLYTIPFNTFFDSDNDVLVYSACLTNGSSLPSWLQFNPSSRMFTGFPLTEDVGNYNLLLTADDGMSRVTSSFNIQVNQGPVVINYPGAQIVVVGTRKEFNVHDVFLSLDGYSLDLTAGLNTGDILPIWINFDNSKSKFIFTPTVVSNPIVIKLRAADPYSSLSVLFSVISQCPIGYRGEDCQTFDCYSILSTNSTVCSSRGNCTAPDTCVCSMGYAGSNCDRMGCFGVPWDVHGVCSGHGTCTGPNQCVCNNGWLNYDCSLTKCNEILNTNSSVCSGVGACIAPNYCDCPLGYSGSQCQDYSCLYDGSDCQVTSCFGVSSNSSSVCSDHGSCVSTDNCLCDDGFYGSKCELWSCFSKVASDLSVCSGIGTCVKPNTCVCNTGFGGNECQFPLCYGYTRNETQVCNGNGYCESPNFCQCTKDALGVECEVKVSDFVMSPDGNMMTATFNSKFNNGYEFEWGSRDNCNYILSNVSLLGNDTTCSIQNETLVLVLGIFSSIQLYDVLEVRIYPKLPGNSSFQYPAHISMSLQDKLITQIQVQPNKSPIIPKVALSVESTNVYDCAPVDLSVLVEIYSLKRTNMVLSSRHFDSETMNHMNYYLSQLSLNPTITSVHIPSSSFLVSTKNRTAEFRFTLSVRSNLGYESESSITIQYTHLPLPVYKTKRSLILSRRSDDYMVVTTPALATTCGNPNLYPTISEWLQVSGEPIVGFNSKEDRFNSSSFLLPPFFFPKVDESYQLTIRSALRDFPFVKSQLDIFVRVVSQELKALIGGADRAEPISSDVILKAIVSDPDQLDDAPDHFEWRCFDTRMLCPEDRHGLTLVIPAFSMLVGYKSFYFRYVKGNRETTASIQINVVAADFPIVRIEGVPLNNRMNNYEGLQLLAVVENYPSSDVYFQWEVYRGGLLLNNSTMTTSTTSASLSIRPNVMTPSARYGFRLTVFLKPDLAHLAYYGTPGVAEAEIQINTQPKDGPFTVTPSEGYALSTVFKLDCMGWQSDTQPYFFSFSFLDEINFSYNKSRMLSMTPTLREQLDVMLPQPTTRADHRLFINVRVSDLSGATIERTISVIVKPHPTISHNTALNSILGNLTLIEKEKLEEKVFGRDLAVLTFALNQVVSINQLNSSNNCTNDCSQSLGQGTCNTITTTCICHQGYHGDDCSLTTDDVYNRKNIRLTLLQRYSQYSEVPTMSPDHLNFRLQTLSAITSKVSELSTDMAILGSNFLNSTLSMNTAPMSETLVKGTAHMINNLLSVSLPSIDSRVSPIDSYQLSVNELTSIVSLKETTDILLSTALANMVQGQEETKLITPNLKACIFKDYASLLDGKTLSIVNDGSSPMSPPQTQQILTIPKGFGTEMISKFNSSTGEQEPTIGLRIVSLIVNPHDTRSHARSRKDLISSDLLSIVFEVNGVTTSIANLTNMIEFIVPGNYSYNDDPSSSSRTAPLCKYWDHSKGVWSTEGVVTLKFSPTSTSCLTSHTTDFAVFVGPYIPPPPPSPSSQIHLPSDFEPSTLDRQSWNVFPWWWIMVAALVSGCFVLGLMSVLVVVVGIMSRKRSHIEDDSYEDDEEGSTYEDMEGDEEIIMRNHQRPHSNCSMESAHDDDMSSETRSHYLNFMYSRADSRASDLSLMAAPYAEQVTDGRGKRYQMTAKSKNETSAFFNKSMMMHEVEYEVNHSDVMHGRRPDADDDENQYGDDDDDDDGAIHWKNHVNNNDNSHESSTENLFVRMDSVTNSSYHNNDRYGKHHRLTGQLKKKNQVAPHIMDDDADSSVMTDDGADLSGPTPLAMDKRHSNNKNNNNAIQDDDLMTEEEEESSSFRQPNNHHHETFQIPSSQQFRNFVVRYVDEEEDEEEEEK